MVNLVIGFNDTILFINVLIIGTGLSSSMPECSFVETSSDQTLPSDGGEPTGRGPRTLLHLFSFCVAIGRDDDCVRGPVWCEDLTGQGGHCCSHEDCSLDDVRLLPDPENDYSQR